jgi:hypothetical protein
MSAAFPENSRYRQRLSNRRFCETFELEIAGLRYTATVGRFADGRVAEIFLSNHKSNSAADTNARDSDNRMQHRAAIWRRRRNYPQGFMP